jgi:Recombination endonuclease VII
MADITWAQLALEGSAVGRTCIKCGKWKAAEAFYRRSSGALRGACRACQIAAQRLRARLPPAVERSVVNGEKLCRSCGRWKPIEEFDRQTRNGQDSGLRSHCRRCRRRASLEYNRRDGGRNAYYQRVYGVTLAWYNARLEMQGGVCAICKRPPDPTYRPHPRLVVDHDHKSVVRGLLCAKCNTALGMFGDDPARLTSAIEYLANFS